MKKLLSIFLLGIFLFNSIGYYGVFVILRDQLNLKMSRELDENEYAGSDAIIVKIPMLLPYQLNLNGYERADGEFEYDGRYYRIFKQHLVKDTLYVMLVENKSIGELKKSMANIAASNGSSDTPASNTAKILNSFIKDFIPTSVQIQCVEIGWSRDFLGLVPCSDHKIIEHTPSSPPPEIV